MTCVIDDSLGREKMVVYTTGLCDFIGLYLSLICKVSICNAAKGQDILVSGTIKEAMYEL